MATPSVSKFCHSCGASLESQFKFCPHCGEATLVGSARAQDLGKRARGQSSNLSNEQKAAASAVRSFSDFKKEKERERSAFFVRNKGGKRAKVNEREVTITIGVMKDPSTLKRGESMPLKVLPSFSAEQTLTAAVEKHAAFNKRFNPKLKYTLVYRDGSQVVDVPGTDPEEPFTIGRYKEVSGFGYSKIALLYLIPQFKKSLCDAKIVLTETDSDSLTDDDPCLGMGNNSYDNRSRDCSNLSPIAVTDERPSTSSNCSSSFAVEDRKKDISNISNVSNTLENSTLNSPTIPKVECPLCFVTFPIHAVEQHASSCSESFGLLASCDVSSSNPLGECSDGEVSTVEPTEIDSSVCSLNVCIHALKEKGLKSDDEPIRVTVRRKMVWEDFRRARNRYYTPDRVLKITFSGEPAVDDGGPKREFFAEMMNFIERRLFPEGRPVNSTMALTKKDYKLAGEVIAMSIMQGGQSPNFLAPQVFGYLCGNVSATNMTSIPHKELCEKLTSAAEEEIGNILLNENIYPILEEVGYQGVPARETKSSVASLITSVCLKDQFGDILTQLSHFEEGLNTYNLLSSLKLHSSVWEPVFVVGKGHAVTASSLIDCFQTFYSESQSKRESEADTYTYFCDFIYSVEVKEIPNICVEDILQWLTGARKIPPLGLPRKITCQFLHGCQQGCKCRPTTSTCDLIITLPVHLNTEEDMKEIMASALTDCIGFGLL